MTIELRINPLTFIGIKIQESLDEGSLVWVGGRGVFVIGGVEEGHEVTLFVEDPGGGAYEGKEDKGQTHLGT